MAPTPPRPTRSRGALAPSLSGGRQFTVAYLEAIWQALVAALPIGAAPARPARARALAAALPPVAGGVASLPSMVMVSNVNGPAGDRGACRRQPDRPVRNGSLAGSGRLTE